jgi:streptogramin lyase
MQFNSIFETQAGEVCVTGGDYRYRSIKCFDGKVFHSTWPGLPVQVTRFGWAQQQATFQDHAGEWWVATAQGLFRLPKVSRLEDLARTAPKRVYTIRDGLAWSEISRLYEDSHGDIWITTEARTGSLSKWERSTDKIRTYTEPSLPSSNGDDTLATVFREDGFGSMWIGFRDNGGLVRHRNGQFMVFRSADGIPAGSINSLYVDHANRLWIASSEGGLGRVDHPLEDHPRFIRYTTAESLSSNEIWSITEDGSGRIYASTGRGLDRLDPESGPEAHRVTHYTEADGLAKGGLRVSLRDRRGALWFVTTRGISRLEPTAEQPSHPPSVLIDGLRIAGVKHPVSEIGESEIGPLELPPDRNDVQVSCVGLDAMLAKNFNTITVFRAGSSTEAP